MISQLILTVVTIAMILFFLAFFVYVFAQNRKYHERSQAGPFADATVIEVEKIREQNRSGHDCRCHLVYVDNYVTEHKAILVLPYDDVPVGGQIRIAYNPNDFADVVFIQALYMDTPEYIAAMEAKGFRRVDDGFVRDTPSSSLYLKSNTKER